MSLRDRPHSVEIDETGVCVFESRHSADFAMSRQSWPFGKLCIIEDGMGTLDYEGQLVSIKSHDVIYLPAGSSHRLIDDPAKPLSLMMACFHVSVLQEEACCAELIDAFRDRFPAGQPLSLTDSYRVAGAMNSYQLMIFEQSRRRSGVTAMIWAQLIGLMVMLLRTHEDYAARDAVDEGDRLFMASIEMLDNQFYRPIQIKELADVAMLSYRAYTDRFKKQTGKTVNRYLAELRVEYAKQRMAQSGNILHSALQAGFGDLAHFYRVFKRIEGTTPKSYLTSLRDTDQ